MVRVRFVHVWKTEEIQIIPFMTYADNQNQVYK